MAELTFVTARRHVTHILANNRRIIVARDTGCGELAMIYSGRYPGYGAVMTVIAGILTGYMARVLTDCPGTIMASETGCSDFGVIKARRCPGNRAVALVTKVITLEVINGLAGGLDPVMAADAGTGDGYVVHACICPTHLGMTVIADIATIDVAGGFARCSDQTGRSMTALAALRRAFEDAVLMTTLATNLSVCAVKQETGCVMVEFGGLHQLAE